MGVYSTGRILQPSCEFQKTNRLLMREKVIGVFSVEFLRRRDRNWRNLLLRPLFNSSLTKLHSAAYAQNAEIGQYIRAYLYAYSHQRRTASVWEG